MSVPRTDDELDELLSRPPPVLVDALRRLDGDIAVLGVAGKMGVTLAMLARRALEAAGSSARVIGVARFSDADARAKLDRAGVETIRCDLLDHDAVRALPEAANVVFMAGKKFGTTDGEALTWATNTVLPALVAERYRDSRIVAFSTGCVYPLVAAGTGGSREDDPPGPIGEYAQSCLGRERVLEHASRRHGTPICILRLNYAIDLRYGVLHDIARRIVEGEPIDLSVAHFNCIWQGDANAAALLAFRECRAPAAVLNLTGPGIIAVRDVATRLADALGRDVTFTGEEGSTAYLADATEAIRRLGKPEVTLDEMVSWTAEWVRAGGSSLGKPTHFEVRDGRF